MDEMWQDIKNLGDKRKIRINELCTKERKDAALTAILIFLKCMNSFGFGLTRLTRLSNEWGHLIQRSYQDGTVEKMEIPEDLPEAGALLCDVDREFADLSGRMRRQIRAYLEYNRRDAQWVAIEVGREPIHKMTEYGRDKMETLVKEFMADLQNFWEDRDSHEDRLKHWLEAEIGFCYERGQLQSYRDGDNKPIKKATAERKMKEQALRDKREADRERLRLEAQAK